MKSFYLTGYVECLDNVTFEKTCKKLKKYSLVKSYLKGYKKAKSKIIKDHLI